MLTKATSTTSACGRDGTEDSFDGQGDLMGEMLFGNDMCGVFERG